MCSIPFQLCCIEKLTTTLPQNRRTSLLDRIDIDDSRYDLGYLEEPLNEPFIQHVPYHGWRLGSWLSSVPLTANASHWKEPMLDVGKAWTVWVSDGLLWLDGVVTDRSFPAHALFGLRSVLFTWLSRDFWKEKDCTGLLWPCRVCTSKIPAVY